ncbi:regulator of protease activity HflC (stomatin/prohibitin superfamily) [Mycoplasma testudineum]|uniref:Regulator of protease activity HflC (Stomatin/prohibitin superfamily) n=1 Tax=Mycoplasma testudineum TaxID=244584 RepID=A0A4V3C389_9MOLU|nr:SPFH domain-containing protein [Mycoplasma testudineum]OYD27182.1 peptidase [Mycoplasma testudineum]TDO21059.1 regulator of protease activity HflC (stomatin/prohibitin superfamily) [Mycoplasma testudineum]
MDIGAIIGIVILVLVLLLEIILIAISVKVVPQANFYIVERLGKYLKTWKGGIHFLVPFVDKIVLRETLREKVIDFPSQNVITKDNVTMKVNTVTYMQIMDSQKYFYGVESAILAIENLVATTLRNFLGNVTVDETLTSRNRINGELTQILDEASDAWGVKVNRVELKEITPPPTILQSMEKLLQAERDKQAIITEAQGYKTAKIARAEGDSEAMVKIASANKERIVLEAEANKEKMILEGQARKQYVELLAKAGVDEKVLQWIALDKIDSLANGNATKIIIPPDLAQVSKVMATFDAIAKKDK